MKFFLISCFLLVLIQDAYGDCSPPCNRCQSDTCKRCESSYYLSRDASCIHCSELIPKCVNCDGRSVECAVCDIGYAPDTYLHECQACPDVIPHCELCSQDYSLTGHVRCDQCEAGFELDGNQCIPSCSVTPRPIQHYPDLYRGSIIFVDFPFQCSGSVSAVEFYAERAGTFYFSAWRPSASGDSWMFLGYNAIVSEGEGAQTYTIPSDEQIVVSSSDVFGFVYEKGVRYRVISSENISKRHRDGTSSRFVNTRETLEDLSIGVNRSALAGGGNTERIVPINPIVS